MATRGPRLDDAQLAAVTRTEALSQFAAVAGRAWREDDEVELHRLGESDPVDLPTRRQEREWFIDNVRNLVDDIRDPELREHLSIKVDALVAALAGGPGIPAASCTASCVRSALSCGTGTLRTSLAAVGAQRGRNSRRSPSWCSGSTGSRSRKTDGPRPA
jgi:hypothetical protein